jgi:hypothetical protein
MAGPPLNFAPAWKERLSEWLRATPGILAGTANHAFGFGAQSSIPSTSRRYSSEIALSRNGGRNQIDVAE